ncbi:MAG: YciI family protein [Gemmatimonadaceae bacterium]
MSYALALIRYRRPLEEVIANTDDHRAYLRELKARGVLIASGPFDPRSGGALLLRLPDENSAEALDAVRDGDPFWQRGIAQYELLAWKPTIGLDELDGLGVLPLA